MGRGTEITVFLSPQKMHNGLLLTKRSQNSVPPPAVRVPVGSWRQVDKDMWIHAHQALSPAHVGHGTCMCCMSVTHMPTPLLLGRHSWVCECDRGNRNSGHSFWMVNRLRWFSFLLLCVFSSWLFCLLILHFIFQFSSLAAFTCLSPLLSFSLSEHTHPLPDAPGATLTLYPSFQIRLWFLCPSWGPDGPPAVLQLRS